MRFSLSMMTRGRNRTLLLASWGLCDLFTAAWNKNASRPTVANNLKTKPSVPSALLVSFEYTNLFCLITGVARTSVTAGDAPMIFATQGLITRLLTGRTGSVTALSIARMFPTVSHPLAFDFTCKLLEALYLLGERGDPFNSGSCHLHNLKLVISPLSVCFRIDIALPQVASTSRKHPYGIFQRTRVFRKPTSFHTCHHRSGWLRCTPEYMCSCHKDSGVFD